MEDSETKTAALEKVAELEDELGHVCVSFNIYHYFIFHIHLYIINHLLSLYPSSETHLL
jgi:hypothetical protein